MSDIIVQKSENLNGRVSISGAKNSALPIMAAAILTPHKCEISNLPDLSDILIMQTLLDNIGCTIDQKDGGVYLQCENVINSTAPYELVSRLRGSFLLAGPLLARTGHTRISLPGGCPIGTRPVDLHLKGFAALGADISQGHGYIDVSAKRMHGAKIYLDFPSVGATENIMMASCGADGETVIENAAAEPEIADLAVFLNKLGANISGAGSDTIRIIGIKEMRGAQHRIIPDRIEAGTFMTAVAITNGCAVIDGVICPHIKPISAKLTEMGAKITEGDGFVEVNAQEPITSANIKTMPFPGFPTDMQAQFTALMSAAAGTGIIVETVFENRFLHVGELGRMGANIKIDGRAAIVEGGANLMGAPVSAMDLRGGASLILAGLAASGTTRISGYDHIKRGYDNIVGKLRGLGANIYMSQ